MYRLTEYLFFFFPLFVLLLCLAYPLRFCQCFRFLGTAKPHWLWRLVLAPVLKCLFDRLVWHPRNLFPTYRCAGSQSVSVPCGLVLLNMA